jgi:hypothetical protein
MTDDHEPKWVQVQQKVIDDLLSLKAKRSMWTDHEKKKKKKKKKNQNAFSLRAVVV